MDCSRAASGGCSPASRGSSSRSSERRENAAPPLGAQLSSSAVGHTSVEQMTVSWSLPPRSPGRVVAELNEVAPGKRGSFRGWSSCDDGRCTHPRQREASGRCSAAAVGDGVLQRRWVQMRSNTRRRRPRGASSSRAGRHLSEDGTDAPQVDRRAVRQLQQQFGRAVPPAAHVVRHLTRDELRLWLLRWRRRRRRRSLLAARALVLHRVALRRRVALGPHARQREPIAGAVDAATQVEVAELDGAVRVDEHILRLEVAVDAAEGVDVREAGEYLRHDRLQRRLVELPRRPYEGAEQVVPVHVVHHHEERVELLALGAEYGVERDDVRVREAAEQPDFAQDAQGVARVAEERLDALDRSKLTSLCVLHARHHAVGSLADDGFDAVAPSGCLADAVEEVAGGHALSTLAARA
eukprot:1019722-Prymnesium_polylepis.1